jgi:hypothetical protein
MTRSSQYFYFAEVIREKRRASIEGCLECLEQSGAALEDILIENRQHRADTYLMRHTS